MSIDDFHSIFDNLYVTLDEQHTWSKTYDISGSWKAGRSGEDVPVNYISKVRNGETIEVYSALENFGCVARKI